jgi:hypothetical protein
VSRIGDSCEIDSSHDPVVLLQLGFVHSFVGHRGNRKM